MESRDHIKKRNIIKLINMKKHIYFLAIAGLMVACSSESKQKEEVSEELNKQTEMMNEATVKADDLIKKSESDFNKNQDEIDSLLNSI